MLLLTRRRAVPSALAAQTKSADSPSVAQFDPKEWDVPFGADTRPRDPYADAQGRVWFVGQNGNYVAYLDNKTGKFKRFEIDPGTNPHNLVVEKGMVWFTGNRNNRTRQARSGDRQADDVHDSRHAACAIRTRSRSTRSRGSPGSRRRAPGRSAGSSRRPGKFRLWKTGKGSRPYGIVLDSHGQPWFDLFGTNKIGTVDPKTMEFKSFALPNDTTRPRRIAITSDDRIFYGDYTRGYLGHLDPKTGKTEEWRLPLGRRALPYAMTTDDKDNIWIAQNGYPGIPSTLVAFDPKTKKFVAEVPVGKPENNTIRHMTFDKATRQIWFGTDQGAIGKIAVPRAAFVP